MDRKAIGEKVRKLREAKDWTQNKLATLAGISTSYIPDIEKGLKCPTVEVLDGICFALGITLVDFFSETKKENNKVSSLTKEQTKLLNDFLNSL